MKFKITINAENHVDLAKLIPYGTGENSVLLSRVFREDGEKWGNCVLRAWKARAPSAKMIPKPCMKGLPDIHQLINYAQIRGWRVTIPPETYHVTLLWEQKAPEVEVAD